MADIKFVSKLDNDSLYGKIAAPLRQVIIDNASKNTREEQLLKLLFNVQKSDYFAEAGTGQTGLGTMKPVDEGGQLGSQKPQNTYNKIIEHATFGDSVQLTFEMLQDAQGGLAVSKARPMYAAIGNAYVRSRLEFATKALTAGVAKTFTYNGKSFDCTTPDGEALFSKTHKVKGTGGQVCNVYTNAFSADMLNTLQNYGRNFLNETGNITGNVFDTIIIPGNAPALEKAVKAVLASEGEVGSANNNYNIQYGLWNLVVNPYWQASGSAAPYILMSSKANEQTNASAFYDRCPLLVKETEDRDFNVDISYKARFSAGFFDWRHVVMGGMTGGTTLS